MTTPTSSAKPKERLGEANTAEVAVVVAMKFATELGQPVGRTGPAVELPASGPLDLTTEGLAVGTTMAVDAWTSEVATIVSLLAPIAAEATKAAYVPTAPLPSLRGLDTTPTAVVGGPNVKRLAVADIEPAATAQLGLAAAIAVLKVAGLVVHLAGPVAARIEVSVGRAGPVVGPCGTAAKTVVGLEVAVGKVPTRPADLDVRELPYRPTRLVAAPPGLLVAPAKARLVAIPDVADVAAEAAMEARLLAIDAGIQTAAEATWLAAPTAGPASVEVLPASGAALADELARPGVTTSNGQARLTDTLPNGLDVAAAVTA